MYDIITFLSILLIGAGAIILATALLILVLEALTDYKWP